MQRVAGRPIHHPAGYLWCAAAAKPKAFCFAPSRSLHAAAELMEISIGVHHARCCHGRLPLLLIRARPFDACSEILATLLATRQSRARRLRTRPHNTLMCFANN